MLGTEQATLEQNSWISGFYESMRLQNFEAELSTLPASILYLAVTPSAITIDFSFSQEKQFQSPVLDLLIFEIGSHLG